MDVEDNIEQGIVPIKMADFIAYVALQKKLSFTDAMCYLYDSPMAEMLYDKKSKWWYLDNKTLFVQIECERKKQNVPLSSKQQQFIVFCIEVYARRQALSSLQTYALFKAKGLIPFLKNNFEILHTQGEEYILDEIKLYLKRRKNI